MKPVARACSLSVLLTHTQTHLATLCPALLLIYPKLYKTRFRYQCASKSMPFVAIGKQVGDDLAEAIVSEPSSDIHITFRYDENKFGLAWDRFYAFLFLFFVLPLTAATAYRSAKIGLALKYTTKSLVVLLELPVAVLLFSYIVIGPLLFSPNTGSLRLA